MKDAATYCAAAADRDKEAESTNGAVAATKSVLRGSTLSTCCVDVIPRCFRHCSMAD